MGDTLLKQHATRTLAFLDRFPGRYVAEVTRYANEKTTQKGRTHPLSYRLQQDRSRTASDRNILQAGDSFAIFTESSFIPYGKFLK